MYGVTVPSRTFLFRPKTAEEKLAYARDTVVSGWQRAKSCAGTVPKVLPSYDRYRHIDCLNIDMNRSLSVNQTLPNSIIKSLARCVVPTRFYRVTVAYRVRDFLARRGMRMMLGDGTLLGEHATRVASHASRSLQAGIASVASFRIQATLTSGFSLMNTMSRCGTCRRTP